MVVLALGLACAPPAAAASSRLSSHGGPVLHSSAPYLVFWTPAGESIPASSEALMERFFTDVAADSGKSSNVFGVLRQYYDGAGFADYRQTFNPARQVIVDTHAYPPLDSGACPDVGGPYPTCITDWQIQSELERLITADGLPTAGSWSASELRADAPIYFVVLPADVNVCLLFGTACTDNRPCAYHTRFADRHNQYVLYAPMPLQPLRNGSLLYPNHKSVCQLDATTALQSPSGDLNADVVINLLSHEDAETITDPIDQTSGWFNTSTHQEVGDQCERTAAFDPAKGANPNAYLPTLGGSEPAGTLSTQLINGHPYYLQSEWSNGNGNCEMRPSPGRITPRFNVTGRRHAGGTPLIFNPTASTSANALSSATWSFGDRSQPAFHSGRATLQRVKHRYRKAGLFTVTLTLVDDRGNLKATTRRVSVHAR
jgi:hypothetical protein